MLPAAAGVTKMERLVPLSEPVTTGFELTTLIRYPVPVVVPAGIVALIVPAVVLVSVPILTGEVKLPAAFDNCAVNIFPAFAAALTENGTSTDEPAHRFEDEIAFVVIVVILGDELIVKFTFDMSKKIFPTDSTLIRAFVLVTTGRVTDSDPSLRVFETSV
jgi:hypothetical protein